MTSHDGHTQSIGYSTLWRIEKRGDYVTAVNPTTGEVWESRDMFAVCFAIAAGGTDPAATADWLRYLAARCDEESLAAARSGQGD